MKVGPYHWACDRKNKSRTLVPCFLPAPIQTQTIYIIQSKKLLRYEKLRKIRN